MWGGERYVWRAGYWGRVRPGYVYVPSHYRWTPQGYVLIPGYWDLVVSRRGVMYSPVYIDPVVVGPRYVYTPAFAVRETVVLDTMFIRPASCHYYFGDYYGPRYVAFGFEPVVVYSRRYYDPIIVYERWHYRDNPRWLDIQVGLVMDRHAGRVLLPPRVITPANYVALSVSFGPTRVVLAARGERPVRLDMAARARAREVAVAHREAMVMERHRAEAHREGGPLTRPHSASFNVAPVHPVGHVPPAAQPHPSVSPVHPGVSPVHPGVTPGQPGGPPGHPALGNPKGAPPGHTPLKKEEKRKG
jgi:hypothetical protein